MDIYLYCYTFFSLTELSRLHITFKVNGSNPIIFSWPGQSPGRAIVLPPASVLALALVVVAAAVLEKC